MTWPDKVKEMGAESAVAALLRVSREFGDTVETVRRPIVDMLADLVGRPEFIQAVESQLAREENRHLLLERQFAKPLEEISKDRQISEEIRSAANNLLSLRQKSYRWPELWDVRRSDGSAVVTAWLKLPGLSCNPFGPVVAELDPLLPEYRTDLPAFDQLREPQPTVVFGASGAGKTAAAKLLAHDCAYPPVNPRNKGVFPACVSLLTEEPGRDVRHAHLESLVRGVSRALLRFLARNPNAFLQQNRASQKVIAHLLLLLGGSVEGLLYQLEQARFETTPADERMQTKIIKFRRTIPLDQTPDETALCDLLRNGRPAGFSSVYVLADTAKYPSTDAEASELAERTRPLLDLGIALARASVYVKLFLPDRFRPHLNIPAGWRVASIEWSPDELASFLEARMRQAGVPSLGALFGPDVPSDPSPDKQLISAAQGSPRRLIELGNQLLEYHAEHTPDESKLNAEDLDAILSDAPVAAQMEDVDVADSRMKDVFLSHASVDKEAYVRPFAEELKQQGITFWLDEAEIKWGDRITRKINEGLRCSRFVIIFLSERFLERNWPLTELEAALSTENAQGQTVVLPIIVGEPAKLLAKYPLLRDKKYLRWEDGVPQIISELKRVLASAGGSVPD